MLHPQRLLLFVSFLGCFIHVEAAELEPVLEQVPTISKRKGLGSKRPSALPSLFSLPLSCSDLNEQDEKERTAFNVEVTRLREIIRTPGKHVVVFDCHGSLTNKKMPEENEGPYRRVVDLYHEFSALGAEVVISSAWPVMLEVLQSLRAAGIEHTEEVLTEIVFEERTQTEYRIVHAGNVVSARQEPHFESIFANKREAGIWYAKRQDLTELSSITLFDDQDVNIHTFMGRPGELFGVRYPLPQGILVPSYAVLNPE